MLKDGTKHVFERYNDFNGTVEEFIEYELAHQEALLEVRDRFNRNSIRFVS